MAGLTLEIVEGAQAGRQVQLDSVVDIGRDASLPLHLDEDGQVSRRHARVTAQGGQAVVEDLGSTNGTFVNDQPIHSPRELRPGDRVRIGLTVLQVRSKAQVQDRPSAVRPVPQVTALDASVLNPVGPNQLGGGIPAGGFVAAPVQPSEPALNLPPQPPPPLPGVRRDAPAVAPGAGFRAAETPAGYVPPEVVGDDQAVSDYGALANLVDANVKQRRNIAAFAMLGASGLAVLLYFGLT
jgi:pSer/pThr/pTyr-binding forkhead associated (FHA) protein